MSQLSGITARNRLLSLLDSCSNSSRNSSASNSAHGSPAQPSDEFHPLLIDLVLEKTFGYLPKEDLYRCRLVCRTWRTAGLNILQSRGGIINLDCRNIGEHINFIDEQSNPNFLKRYDLAFPDYCTENGISEIVNGVNKLVEYFGSKCVYSLTYHHHENKTDWAHNSILGKFLSVTQLISPGLQVLRLNNNGQLPALLNSFASMVAKLHFPELTQFYYYGFTDKENDTSARIVAKIIDSSPKLNSLMLLECYGGNIHETNLTNLLNLLPNCSTLNNITELQITLRCLSAGETFADIYFPQLKKLTVSMNHLFRLHDDGLEIMQRPFASVIQFIRRHSTTLEYLDCNFYEFLRSSSEEFLSMLPYLPKLQKLGYHVRSHKLGAFFMPNFIQVANVDSNKFPSLTSVSTEIGSMFCPLDIPAFCLRDKVHLTVLDMCSNSFPIQPEDSSTSIVVKIDQNPFYSTQPNPENNPTILDNVKRLYSLYPNTKKIVINNQIEKLSASDDDFVQKFVIAFCEEMVGLEELEIRNYDVDWLVTALLNSPVALQTLQGLKRLRIPSIEKYMNSTPSGSVHPRNLKKTMRQRKCYMHSDASLDYMQILDFLPNLKIFEFGSEFICPKTCFPSPLREQVLDKQLRNLCWKFPNVRIRFL